MTHTVLVVDPDPIALSDTTEIVAGAGYAVTAANSFTEARRQLVIARPDVLITAVRLGGYNGLHLVIRTRAMFGDVVSIVVHTVPDPVLQADALSYNALYLVTPIDAQLLLEVIAQRLDGRAARPSMRIPRRWQRKSVAEVDATLGGAPAAVVEVGYGGARLRLGRVPENLSRRPQPTMLRTADVEARVRPVWHRWAGADGPSWCGVEIDEADGDSQRAWRAFVDAAN